MGSEIKNIFTCRHCYWGDQCPAPHLEACEYFDPIGDIEVELEEQLLIEAGRQQFMAEWNKLIAEI